MRALVVSEYYPRRGDPVLGIWAHRQAVAARDAGADVEVIVLPTGDAPSIRFNDLAHGAGLAEALAERAVRILQLQHFLEPVVVLGRFRAQPFQAGGTRGAGARAMASSRPQSGEATMPSDESFARSLPISRYPSTSPRRRSARTSDHPPALRTSPPPTSSGRRPIRVPAARNSW